MMMNNIARIWRGTVMAIATSAMIDGIAYIIWGDSIIKGSSYAILDKLPYGIRLYGIAMVALAFILLIGVHRRGQFAEKALLAMFVFGVLMGCEIIGGWAIDGRINFSPITKWFAIAWLSLWLSMHCPCRRYRANAHGRH